MPIQQHRTSYASSQPSTSYLGSQPSTSYVGSPPSTSYAASQPSRSYAGSISSFQTPGSFREPCEGDACLQAVNKTWYCVSCDCSFCEVCWDKQPAHKPKKRGADGYGHERIDKLVVERYRSILEPSSNAEEQETLHREDEDTTWFGIGRDRADDPVFEDYGRFAALMQDSSSKPGVIRHPQLVSFIGQTGNCLSTERRNLLIDLRCWEKYRREYAHQPSRFENKSDSEISLSGAFARIGQRQRTCLGERPPVRRSRFLSERYADTLRRLRRS